MQKLVESLIKFFKLIFLEDKFFILQRDSTKQIPKEVQLFLIMSCFVLGNV